MKKLSVILLAVMIAVVSVVPAFAFSNEFYGDFPIIDEAQVDKGKYPYWVCVNEWGDVYLYAFANEPTVDYRNDGTISLNLVGAYMKFKYSDTHWMHQGGGSNQYFSTDSTASIRATNFVLYDVNGDVYFPKLSMAEQILGVANNTIKNDTVPSVNTAMTILCVTGVGLLAMLVLLKLFGKRSLIHR